MLLIIAGVLAAILYMLLAPGTWYQYRRCKRGSIKGHKAYFEFVSHDHQVRIVGIVEYKG